MWNEQLQSKQGTLQVEANGCCFKIILSLMVSKTLYEGTNQTLSSTNIHKAYISDSI